MKKPDVIKLLRCWGDRERSIDRDHEDPVPVVVAPKRTAAGSIRRYRRWMAHRLFRVAPWSWRRDIEQLDLAASLFERATELDVRARAECQNIWRDSASSTLHCLAMT
jgi:hypothetical protein